MKIIANNLYVHKSNLEELYSSISQKAVEEIQLVFAWAFNNDFHFEVVKYNRKANTVSLINAIGWKERFEPIVSDSVIFNPETGHFKTRTGGSQVYHCKELFVSKDYHGFCIEEAAERTKLLNSLDIIRANKCRTGSLKWWCQFLKDQDLPAYMPMFFNKHSNA